MFSCIDVCDLGIPDSSNPLLQPSIRSPCAVFLIWDSRQRSPLPTPSHHHLNVIIISRALKTKNICHPFLWHGRRQTLRSRGRSRVTLDLRWKLIAILPSKNNQYLITHLQAKIRALLLLLLLLLHHHRLLRKQVTSRCPRRS